MFKKKSFKSVEEYEEYLRKQREKEIKREYWKQEVLDTVKLIGVLTVVGVTVGVAATAVTKLL